MENGSECKTEHLLQLNRVFLHSDRGSIISKSALTESYGFCEKQVGSYSEVMGSAICSLDYGAMVAIERAATYDPDMYEAVQYIEHPRCDETPVKYATTEEPLDLADAVLALTDALEDEYTLDISEDQMPLDTGGRSLAKLLQSDLAYGMLLKKKSDDTYIYVTGKCI